MSEASEERQLYYITFTQAELDGRGWCGDRTYHFLYNTAAGIAVNVSGTFVRNSFSTARPISHIAKLWQKKTLDDLLQNGLRKKTIDNDLPVHREYDVQQDISNFSSQVLKGVEYDELKKQITALAELTVKYEGLDEALFETLASTGFILQDKKEAEKALEDSATKKRLAGIVKTLPVTDTTVTVAERLGLNNYDTRSKKSPETYFRKSVDRYLHGESWSRLDDFANMLVQAKKQDMSHDLVQQLAKITYKLARRERNYKHLIYAAEILEKPKDEILAIKKKRLYHIMKNSGTYYLIVDHVQIDNPTLKLKELAKDINQEDVLELAVKAYVELMPKRRGWFSQRMQKLFKKEEEHTEFKYNPRVDNTSNIVNALELVIAFDLGQERHVEAGKAFIGVYKPQYERLRYNFEGRVFERYGLDTLLPELTKPLFVKMFEPTLRESYHPYCEVSPGEAKKLAEKHNIPEEYVREVVQRVYDEHIRKGSMEYAYETRLFFKDKIVDPKITLDDLSALVQLQKSA